LANFGSATFCDNIAHSSYNSLQATLERRSGGGAFDFLAAYTYARAMDDAPTPLGSNGDDGYPNTNIQPIQYQYSSSPFDVRHRLTLNATGRLPSLYRAKMQSASAEGSQFFNIGLRSLLEEWSASLTFVSQTGNPFSVTPDYSLFHAASGASAVYAELLTNPFRGGGAPPASNPGIACPAEVRNRTHWYNPCAFGNPASGSLIAAGSAVGGDAGLPYLGGKRDDVYGPGYQRINISLFKDFPLSGQRILEFRTDGFNLLNTPSYANPNNNSTGGGLQSGIATNSSAGGQLTSPRFFQNFTPDARFLQFSLKYIF
jgi:hypothetical protein